jgi:hypothetical protein
LSDGERWLWLQWLAEGTNGDGLCGFDRTGWDSSIWILHSIFEDPSPNYEATQDDLHRQRVAAGLEPPFEKILTDAGAVVVGNSVGMSEPRGVECERIRWSQLAERMEIDFRQKTVPPCFRWFPYTSWPAGLWPPDEGSLDPESLHTLVEWLTDRSPAGDATECVGYFTPLIGANFDRPLMYQFRLSEIQELATAATIDTTPSNWWPLDKSWFIYTDWDLWATKISATSSLLASLSTVTDLEQITWP